MKSLSNRTWEWSASHLPSDSFGFLSNHEWFLGFPIIHVRGCLFCPRANTGHSFTSTHIQNLRLLKVGGHEARNRNHWQKQKIASTNNVHHQLSSLESAYLHWASDYKTSCMLRWSLIRGKHWILLEAYYDCKFMETVYMRVKYRVFLVACQEAQTERKPFSLRLSTVPLRPTSKGMNFTPRPSICCLDTRGANSNGSSFSHLHYQWMMHH